MLTKKDKFIYAFIIVFTIAFIAIGVVSGLTPKAYAEEADYNELTETFNLLSSHYNLTGDIDDYGFIYWYDKKGTDKALALRIYENPDSVVSLHTNNSRAYYTSSNPSTRCYCIFHGGNTGNLFSNDESNTNITFYDSKEIYGNFDVFNTLSGVSYNKVSFIASIDTISSAGLLSELYDISFIVQGVSDEKHSSLISRPLAVTPIAVRDDTGYNLIYLEVPQLGTDLYHNDVIWGYYLFKPRYDTDKYFFNGLKLSFAYDPLQDASDLDSYPASSFFEASVNSQPISPNGGLTVNSMSFLFGGSVHTYSNRVLNGYDYSSTDNNLYPTFMFHSIATCNRYSAGSFCYNFDDSGLMKVDENGNASAATDEDKDDLAEDGNNRNDDTKEELGFVPRAVNYPSLVQNFDYNTDFSNYDFSGSKSLFDIIFEHEYIMSIFFMSIVFGILGYVLFGKG